MKQWTKQNIPGIALCTVLAVPAWLAGNQLPLVGGPILGILLGMLAALWRRPPLLQPGIAFTGKKLLQAAIVLLGFGMNLFAVVRVGGQTLLLMVFTLAAAFLAAWAFGRLLRVERNANVLIGVGTAICGGSAIAATAPVIGARDDEIAQSISTIFLFNIIAAFLFPALGHLMGMDDQAFGLWAGTAINDTSSVVAAGYAFSAEAGDLAVIVKLTRTLMILPITLTLALWTARRSARQGSTFSFRKIFPWFVLGFLAASVVGTFAPLPPALLAFLPQAGKFLIVMAMAAIGLNTNVVKLVKSGWRPLLLGLCCWAVLTAASLLAQVVLL